MSGLRRGLFAATAVFAVAAVAGIWWLYGNLDAIARRAIVHYGSQMTGARVDIDAVSLHTTGGEGTVRGLVVGNPAGFSTPYALKVGAIALEVDVRTLAGSVIVVRRIVIDSPDMYYEQGARQTNFAAIQQNIAQSLASGKADDGAGDRAGSAPARRLIVDELTIRNVHAHASGAPLLGQTVTATLPDIHLRELGRAEGGLTPAQLGQTVARALGQRLTARWNFGRGIESLGERASKRLKGLFGR